MLHIELTSKDLVKLSFVIVILSLISAHMGVKSTGSTTCFLFNILVWWILEGCIWSNAFLIINVFTIVLAFIVTQLSPHHH